MEMHAPDETSGTSTCHEADEHPRMSNATVSARGNHTEAIELHTLRARVKQLEEEKLALEIQVNQLTASLTTTLLKQITWL